jgi:cytochrome c biogenesis protein CcmG, thiol:disulfide interchange protein DsbE
MRFTIVVSYLIAVLRKSRKQNMRIGVVAMRRFWIFASALMLLVSGCDRGDSPSNIGRKAPQFTLSDGTVSTDLSKLRGQVVVLNLWATWCPTCVEELPSLLELHRRMPHLAIVAISIDQDDVVYRNFLTQHHVDLITVRDASQQVNAMYGTAQIPESYIIDRNGILRRKLVSAQDWTNPEIISFLNNM